MGAVKLDIHRTDRALSSRYTHTDASGETEYTAAGIARLLGDIYRMSAGAEYKGDISAIILRLDLEAALKSRCLTPRQRQVVALRYFAELTQSETAAVIGVAQPTVKEYIDTALDNIAKEMDEGGVEAAQLFAISENAAGPVDAWIGAVYRGEAEWWRVPDDAVAELNRRFPVKEHPQRTKKLDREALDGAKTSVEYPILNDEEMRYRAEEREISRPVVYPRDPYAGRRACAETGAKVKLAIVS